MPLSRITDYDLTHAIEVVVAYFAGVVCGVLFPIIWSAVRLYT